jgi:hypothetical protein
MVHPTMGASPNGVLYGFFLVRLWEQKLAIISSGERHEGELGEWEHVSVSLYKRSGLPTWNLMCRVKELFWTPEETVVQFHPPKSEYVSIAEVLHLWKPPYELQLPPTMTMALTKGNQA